jgi:nicotinate-nucleotide adenylyltransferase
VGTTPVRIGIFGGTFDPVHTAHLEVAEAVKTALGLDRMLLVVANQPWQKEGERPALVGRPGLEACRMEIDRGGPSYTIDTVGQLHATDPQAQLFIVVGSDVVAGLPTWKNEESLRHQATLAVVSRPGSEPVSPPPGWVTVDVPVAPLDVSSTDLRDRLEAGEPVVGMVPRAVMRCIHQRGLYATKR